MSCCSGSPNYSSLYCGTYVPVPGDHITLAITAVHLETAVFLTPGLYALEPESAACYIAAGVTPVADATCRWVRDGGGMYLVVQAANTIKISTLRAGTVDGVLHINRVG